MKIQVPGKTFLVGEYAVLNGGPALGLSTAPYFQINLSKSVVSDVHSLSASGRFLKSKEISQFFQIHDEYKERNILGGFGSSTAEYWSALLKYYGVHNLPSIFEILKDFKNLHQNELIKPSGIDLAFQYFGQVTLADSALNFYQSMDWMFHQLDFAIVPTKLKIPTHEHIKNLSSGQLEGLAELSNNVINSFVGCQENDFLANLKIWSDELENRQLTHLNSVHLRRKLEKHKEILLAKPCGALGADVVLVLFKSEDKRKVLSFINEQGLETLATRENLSAGVASQISVLKETYVD